MKQSLVMGHYKKPIMLFSSEIWGYELKPDTNAIESLFNKFCKYILGVHRNTTNLAIQGELGTFPVLIDVKNMYDFIPFIP